MKHNITKTGLAIFMLIMTIQFGMAQKRVKYRDALPGIINSEPASGIAVLKSYLKDDPLNPSIFLQLGLIYERRFSNSDPIKDYKKAIANIELAKEAFTQCQQYLNEKEVKRSKAEYINFAVFDERGKYTVAMDSIIKKIEEATSIMEEFKKNVPGIYEDFTKSYSHYDRANKLFTQIIGQHSTAKDLYLLFDDDLNNKFDDIKENYELGLKFFAAYKEKISQYDIGYNQKLRVDSIDLYKLDGLAVEINFLENDEIQIWDYGKWVDDTKTYINDQISGLRTMMVENEKLTEEKLNRIAADFESGEFTPLNVDKAFLFTLRKYDLKSVVEPLFLYKESKHALKYLELISNNLDTTSTAALERKISNHGQMLWSVKDAKAVLQQANSRNNEFSYHKYPAFLDEYYKGIQGINQYIQAENEVIQDLFNESVGKIQTLAFKELEEDSLTNTIKYKRLAIPDYTAELPIDSMISIKLVTTHKVENLDGSAYLGGVFYKKTADKIASYVCRKEADGRISWYKEFLLQTDESEENSHTKITALYGGQAGCTFVLHGSHVESNARLNTLYTYDERGNQILAKDLEIDNYPRTINFVEETNSFVIGFNDQELARPGTESTNIILADYNVLGELIWQFTEEIEGNLSGVIVTEGGFLISGNYSAIKDESGNYVQSKSGYATYVIKINKNGSLAKKHLFSSSTPYVTNYIFKAGDHCINIFGSTNQEDPTDMSFSSLVHIIINKDIEVANKIIN